MGGVINAQLYIFVERIILAFLAQVKATQSR